VTPLFVNQDDADPTRRSYRDTRVKSTEARTRAHEQEAGMRSSRTRLALAAAAGVGVVASAAAGGTAAAGDTGQATLAEVRRATVQYHDVDTAIAAGYAATAECVPEMGYHYVNFAQFGAMDPLKPDALLYAADGQGHLRLVAAEWFKVDADQDLATDDDRPTMFGKAFDGPMPGHVDGMPIHYDLHAYIWEANPAGVLATWNRNISCPGG
jgi:hypothetical protein